MTVGENRTQMSRGHGADENSKSLFEKSRGKGWPNLYRLLRGGRMVMAKSLFKIV